MSHLLHQNNSHKNNGYGKHTAREIELQPQTWKKTWQKVCSEQEDLETFCTNVFSHDGLNIVLTGAGSSAFVGDTAAAVWQRSFNRPTQTIPTTDLVTHFEDKIITQDPLLLISFARSGNSPESTAAVELANKYCSTVFHLIITCNPDGELAAMEGSNSYVFLLPPGTEDKSLAMTNSFTSMLMAVIAIPKMLTGKRTKVDEMVTVLSSYGTQLIENYTQLLQKVSTVDFKRIIFLGSGANWGIAKESHLKVQELTNGQVIGKYDSFLGFRHGPKAVISEDTLIVYLLSNQADVHPYERDLVNQIDNHGIDLTTFAISETELSDLDTDYSIALNKKSELDSDLWAIVCTLPAQIIGFYKSLALQYNPDNPSPGGTIARVVEGVTIYPAPQEAI